jgi:ribonuclease HI
VPHGPYESGAEPVSTNQRMEITAVVRALESISGAVFVMSDSTYVVNCFRDRWWEGWLRRGWRNSSGKPVANRDLWEPLLALALDSTRAVRFSWVKGHSGDEMNDLVDLLAVEAATTQRGRSGSNFEP